jgi:hypothetical protein
MLRKYELAKAIFRLLQKNLVFKPYVYALLLDNLAYAKFKLNESNGLPDLF